MPDQPPEDAYGRVTDPQRFAVLHEAGARLAADLEERFDVTRSEGPDADTTLLSDCGPLLRIVRLEPRLRTAAPITLGWTDFPGLAVRLGRWFIVALPHCGCDACDEDPGELLDELDQLVGGVVGGGLTEWFDGRRVGRELWYGQGGHRGGSRLVDAWQLLTRGRPARHRWEPWPVRGAAAAVEAAPTDS